MINNKIKNTSVFMVLVILIFVNTPKLQAQITGQLYLTGPTTVHYGDVVSYSLKDAMDNNAPSNYLYNNFNWMAVDDGSILTYINESYQPDAEVYWDGSPSQEKVYVLYQRQGETYQYYAELNVTVLPTPAVPDAPIVLNSACNQVVLQRNDPPGNIRTGGQDIIWYWQTSPTGTSTANSSSTITVTSGTEYYLRARRSNGLWSDESSSVQYFVGIPAPTIYNVTQPTVTTPTGSVTLAGLPDYGTWVINPGNISGTGISTTITGLNPSGVYNFTVTNSSGCTSNPSANVVINAQATILDAPVLSDILQPDCNNSKGEFTILNYNPSYTYIVTPSTAVSVLGGKILAPQGNYSIKATSEANISSPLTNFTINIQPVTPTAPIVGTITHPTLSTATGSVILTGLPNSWTINPGYFTGSGPVANITGLKAGIVHNFTVTNNSGCISPASADVFINLQPFNCDGISSNENYVHTIAPLIESTDVDALANDQKIESITYYDGIGRPKQKIAIRAGGTNNVDLITHISYDDYGRQDKEYLPYTDGNSCGAFRTADIDLAAKTYYANHFPADINPTASNPYSQKDLESSPLNRVLKLAAPGFDWRLGGGNEIKMDYKTNALQEVKLFTVDFVLENNLYVPKLINSGHYTQGMLYKNTVFDENSTANYTELAGSTVEFKNKEGQIVLKRAYSTVGQGTTNERHDTYYVYDDFGNLSFVIPPKAVDLIDSAGIDSNLESSVVLEFDSPQLNLKASNSITLKQGFHAKAGSTFSAIIDNGSQNALDNLCYQYRYDQRNRLIEKKLPGKDWEYIVYNNQDKPILTQDANLRNQNKWLFTKYDVFDRVVYTGEYINNIEITRSGMQNLANGSVVLTENRQSTPVTINGTSINYSNNAFPNSGIDLFTTTYYDDYNNIDLDGATAATAYGITPITYPKALNTCTKLRVLGTNNWITNVTYYDTKGRVIYNYNKNNFLNITASEKTQLDFTGKVLETTSTHKRDNDALISIIDSYSYDQAGRLLTQIQTINGQSQEVIKSNTYDNLGKLESKGVGGKINQNRLQTVDYSYNIRGWLKNINNVNAIGTDLFAFQINYNNPISGTPLYNGNISQTLWKTANTDTSLKGYLHEYDALNRLRFAIGEAQDQQEIVSYDKNGNIMSMYRTGIKPINSPSSKSKMQIIDDLNYTYDNGNKLIKVDDNADPNEGFKNGADLAVEYTYDDNGNMKTDANKGITGINYNHLNLPTSIVIDGETINYTYDAAGVKQRKVVNNITTDYAGGFQYENNKLHFFPQPEGYVSNNNGIYEYIYQFKDHLGNVRLSYDKNLTIVEENNYYPFGLKQYDRNNVVNTIGNATAQKYKYQGQERQDELGLNWDSFKYRNYDMAIGRFMSIDPLAEKYSYQSPYNFAENKVISHRELEGLEGAWFQAVWNAHAYAKPNGVPAHVNGIASGLYNSAKGLVNAVTHPVSTAKGIANMAVAGAVGNNPVSMLRVDNAIGTNSFGTSQAVSKSIDKGVNNLINGNGQQRGEVIGEIAGAVVGAKGMGMATKALSSFGKSGALLGTAPSELTNFSKTLVSTSEFDPVKTLYRGTTGSEGTSSAIFLTDNSTVAAGYAQNGMPVMQYEISNSGLYTLEHSGFLEVGPGIQAGSNIISQEYKFMGKDLVKEINNLAKPYNP